MRRIRLWSREVEDRTFNLYDGRIEIAKEVIVIVMETNKERNWVQYSYSIP